MAQSAIFENHAAALGERSDRSGWSAVFALTLCVSTLIASEFMPVSILTPIARDLHLTQGAAGQAIAVSRPFAVLASLSIGSLTRGLEPSRVGGAIVHFEGQRRGLSRAAGED